MFYQRLLPACPTPSQVWKISEELIPELADLSFNNPGTVDLLIGGGVFFDVTSTTTVRRPLNVKNIFLNDSYFGWLVTGELGTVCLTEIRTVGETLEENWRTITDSEKSCFGRLSKANKRSQEEEETIQHFRSTFRRDQEGRFVLRLPIKKEYKYLERSLEMATSKFINIERRLQCDEHLRKEYTKFMTEYIDMDHIHEIIPKDESQNMLVICHITQL
ncbi:uncharacterized protein LOC113555638 [Rhopalosiphum maidis]|uniref:uncharacterized protein LOC113555638 n=1 Tax=Rhopalosiphum maidis TaxID=43146 RepID=UPI000EFEDD45|nr:uncharacterized protein LOC113555638 [Rhopalosiphum maidis]